MGETVDVLVVGECLRVNTRIIRRPLFWMHEVDAMEAADEPEAFRPLSVP